MAIFERQTFNLWHSCVDSTRLDRTSHLNTDYLSKLDFYILAQCLLL